MPWLLIVAASLVLHRPQQLHHTGLVAPWHVGSSRTGEQTGVSSIGRWAIHCTNQGSPFGTTC